jgi:ribosomal protein S18 acetylase RimI-like enzyme
MRVRSLGYRTDLIFVRFEGRITDRADYLVAETPTNPGYYWGNFLLFARPPQLGDFARWQEIFRHEFAHEPRVRHVALAWDSPEGEMGFVQPFIDAGFGLEQGVVLVTDRVVPPPKLNREIQIRPLSTDAEWEQALECQVLSRGEGHEREEYTVFKRAQLAQRRRMAQAGLGQWFGAFLGERLVADLGVYRDGDLARYQSVGTHPDFRRQGICGTLVYEAARFALERMGVRELVMLADEHYHAARIYESVGFKPVEKALGLQLRP